MDIKSKKEREEAQKRIEQLLFPFGGYYNLVSTSNLGLEPGDILLFSYLKKEDGSVMINPKMATERMGIVVSSKRSGEGVTFPSTRLNMLLNVFLIDSLSNSLFYAIVQTLYGREKRCDYHLRPKMLESFLRKQNFRTFNLRWTSGIKKVVINVQKIREQSMTGEG